MKLWLFFEDVILTDSIKIKTTPEKIFGKAIDTSLASVKKHMKEEGENLKRILES
jgi:hypothetical protein